MQFYWLVLGILAGWRVTHLLNGEDGPWDLMVRLRQRAGTGFWAGVLDCFYCMSLWVAVPLALMLGSGAKERLMLWPALSAGAIFLERVTTTRPSPASALYFEDQEDSYVLRQEQEPLSDIKPHETGGSH
jgi:hypothetical protein